MVFTERRCRYQVVYLPWRLDGCEPLATGGRHSHIAQIACDGPAVAIPNSAELGREHATIFLVGRNLAGQQITKAVAVALFLERSIAGAAGKKALEGAIKVLWGWSWAMARNAHDAPVTYQCHHRGLAKNFEDYTVKKTGMAKSDAKKLMGKMAAPNLAGFGNDSTSTVDRREQRKRDQEMGLVPFAVKIDGELVQQLQMLAKSRSMELNALVSEVLTRGLQLVSEENLPPA